MLFFRALISTASRVETIRTQRVWLQQKLGNAQTGRGASFRRLQFCAETSYTKNYASGGRGPRRRPWSLEQVVEMTEAYRGKEKSAAI
jgi:hypothetical protein